MAKAFTNGFYNTKAWVTTREAYKKSVSGLCELCLKEGHINPCEIIHHKIELTPENINNPDITLNWNNLQAVCREHHAQLHGARKKRYKIKEDGTIEIL